MRKLLQQIISESSLLSRKYTSFLFLLVIAVGFTACGKDEVFEDLQTEPETRVVEYEKIFQMYPYRHYYQGNGNDLVDASIEFFVSSYSGLIAQLTSSLNTFSFSNYISLPDPSPSRGVLTTALQIFLIKSTLTDEYLELTTDHPLKLEEYDIDALVSSFSYLILNIGNPYNWPLTWDYILDGFRQEWIDDPFNIVKFIGDLAATSYNKKKSIQVYINTPRHNELQEYINQQGYNFSYMYLDISGL